MTVRRRISLALALMVLLPLLFFILSGYIIRLWILQGGEVDHLMKPGGLTGPLIVFALYTAMNGILTWWVSWKVTTPLSALQASALRMGEGDLNQPVLIGGDKEILDLSRALEQMRLQLQTSLAQQEAHLQARKELISHISHDLRTPLALIRGYAEGLRDNVPPSPEARDRYVGIILDRAHDLECLIDQLLDFSNLDAWKQSIPREPQLPLPLLQKLLFRQKEAFPALDFNLDYSLDYSHDFSADPLKPDDPGQMRPILVHEPSLERILTNLTDNSVRHCGSDPIMITWSLGHTQGGFQLTVQDNGTMPEPMDMAQIFEPLVKGDRSRGKGGSGLGLAIVAGLMEAQGGSVHGSLNSRGGLMIHLTFQEQTIE